MQFKEIYNSTPTDLFTKMVMSYGSKVAEWFYLKFKNFELMYLEEDFIDQFNATVLESHLELLKLKKLLDQQESFELGNKATSNVTSDTTATNDSTNSYSGYNVEGDFAKTNLNSTGINTTDSTSLSINLLDENMKLFDFNFSEITKNIWSRFIVLFVLIW